MQTFMLEKPTKSIKSNPSPSNGMELNDLAPEFILKQRPTEAIKIITVMKSLCLHYHIGLSQG